MSRPLPVLAELEACSFRNKTPDETAAHMKPLLEKYLRLDHNSSNSSQLSLQRQKDHYSHFILRLAFASTEDLRRRFTRVETMLFRMRLAAEDTKDRAEFVKSLNLDWEMVTEHERRELAAELAAASNYGRRGPPDDETWCKVDWERVPDLVEGRRVFLKAGKAYVPSKEQSSMVLAEFTSRLDKSLEVSPHRSRASSGHATDRTLIAHCARAATARRRRPPHAHPRPPLQELHHPRRVLSERFRRPARRCRDYCTQHRQPVAALSRLHVASAPLPTA